MLQRPKNTTKGTRWALYEQAHKTVNVSVDFKYFSSQENVHGHVAVQQVLEENNDVHSSD